MSEFILLVGHGSRDDDGNQEFQAFVESYRTRWQNSNVESCFLELANPTILDGVDACVARGATRIVAVPVILLAASHVKLEIPEFLDAGRKKYPNVEMVYGRNIGLHEEMIDLLSARFGEQVTDVLPDETSIVLMGRGSSDPDANGDLYKIARQLWERTGVQNVEVCFTGITFPRFPDGIRRAVKLGAKRIVVVPYFLFTGVLIKRMQGVLEQLQMEFPHVSMTMAGYFGDHPVLLEIVRQRCEEAAVGQSFMNCDLCQYRKLAAAHHDHHDHHDHHRDERRDAEQEQTTPALTQSGSARGMHS